MSRIDGAATVRDIGYATGFPEAHVANCLAVLETLGAIDYAERPRKIQPATEPVHHSPQASGVAERSPISTKSASTAPPQVPPARTNPDNLPVIGLEGLYDPAELHSPCELEMERKQAILDLFYQLDVLDHYRLLGVAEDADRKAVKSAYYDKVKLFHPDRYFGKNLGEFREKLEKCFARLTDAHETLTTAESRAEYDLYLQSRRESEELERALNVSVTAEDLDFLERRLAEAVSSHFNERAGSSPAVMDSRPSHPEPSITYSASPSSEPGPSSRQLSEEDRRKVLAKKLRLSQPNLRIPSQPAMKAASIPPRDQIAEQLKRQYEQSRRANNAAQLVTLLEDADAALAKGDPVRASNALRAALALAPNDPQIARRLADTQTHAAAALSDTYLKQAEYEEKSARWEAAARSYERAASSKPQAATWEAAARCLLECGGDMRAASDFVRKAIALEPGRAASHLLLGRIFMAARMRSSAIAELERARSLDPNNDTVTTLLKRLERESH